MKLSTETARIIGAKTGNVMRRSIAAVFAPATRAASSKVAPKRRNTGTNSITLNQIPPVDVCTHTIPQKLYGLNSDPLTNGRLFANVLRKPKFGSKSKIHARISGKSGTKYAIQQKDSITLPPGMSVRAISQAKTTERIIAGTRRTTERIKL